MTLQTRVFRYETELEWQGARRAEVRAPGRPALHVTPPEGFPGSDIGHWNPENLFMAALQSCTMLSFLAHCAHNGVEVISYHSTAAGELTRRDDNLRYAFREIGMIVSVTVAGGHHGLAQSLTAKAERDCFISASTNAEIEVAWRINE